jgi:hypothetical protein
MQDLVGVVYKPAMRNGGVPATRGLRWVFVYALVVSCAAWWQLLLAYPHTLTHDAKFFHELSEAARVSIARYHELPLWNAFICGGAAMWDDPQGTSAAPLSLLSLVVGTTRMMELWYVLHSAIGVVCMWLLARVELRLSHPASLVAATAWAFAGVHMVHFTGGSFPWVTCLYFPLALLAWRRAEEDLWAAVGLGLIVALIIYEGGALPLPWLIILLGAETLTRVWPPRRLVPIVRAAAVVALVGLTVGAARFLPLADELSHHHRALAGETDAMKWATLKDIFLARDHDRSVPGQDYVWPEFGAYLGPILLGFSVVGVLLLESGERWLIPLFAFCFALMCGHFAKYAPWSVLRGHVFPFQQMRVPSRFVVLTTVFLTLFVGIAVERLPKLLRRLFAFRGDLVAGAVFGLAMIGVGDMISVGENRLNDNKSWRELALAGPPQNPYVVVHPHLYVGPFKGRDGLESDGHGGQSNPYLDGPQANLIDTECWTEWKFEEGAPIWEGDVPQAKAVTQNVVVKHVERTPNKFKIDVEASAPGRVLINSTYDRQWRTDRGDTLELNKMLAVDVPQGTYTLHVTYWPHGLTLGLFLTSTSSVLLLVLFVRKRRRQSRFPALDAPG